MLQVSPIGFSQRNSQTATPSRTPNRSNFAARNNNDLSFEGSIYINDLDQGALKFLEEQNSKGWFKVDKTVEEISEKLIKKVPEKADEVKEETRIALETKVKTIFKIIDNCIKDIVNDSKVKFTENTDVVINMDQTIPFSELTEKYVIKVSNFGANSKKTLYKFDPQKDMHVDLKLCRIDGNEIITIGKEITSSIENLADNLKKLMNKSAEHEKGIINDTKTSNSIKNSTKSLEGLKADNPEMPEKPKKSFLAGLKFW